MMGFGKLAVAVRVGHSPDPEFFRCWTNMIVGGLRLGDSILRPAIGMAHHTAANCLITAFLRSDCDSVLFVDDDMVFPIDAVEKLRAKGLEYDAVMGLCLSRSEGHKPIIITKNEEGLFCQPGAVDATHVGLIPVAVVGLGFTIIRRSIVEKVKATAPDGECFAWRPRLSEDAYFSECAIAQGGKIAINCDVRIGHRMSQVLYPILDGIKYSTHLSTGG